MGNKPFKKFDPNPTFCSAGGSDEKDRLVYIFNQKTFGENMEERYNYFDDLLNENEALQGVFQNQNLVWPTSVENMVNEQFLENLTADQASAILKVLNI